MKNILRIPIAAFVFALSAVPSWCVEHPGVLVIDADCSSCHAKKVSGKSVHSAMSAACSVCHVANSRGDMTTLTLVMTKEKICFACHEKSAELKQHRPVVKGSCLECHDAHSSGQRMLLLEAGGKPVSALQEK